MQCLALDVADKGILVNEIAPGYVDADGVDNVSGWSTASVGAARTLDDGDAGVTLSGSWTTVASGFGGDRRELILPQVEVASRKRVEIRRL